MTTTPLSPAKPSPSFAMLDVRCIAADPDQVRRSFDDVALAELADSIRSHGIIEPIIVRPGGQEFALRPNVTHTLIAGERRWRAAMLAGLAEVPAIIRSDLAGQDLAVVQVLENLQRADLTLPELGNGVAKLVQAMGTAKTAAQLGKSEGWVSKHARLDALPECITACIAAGTLTSADMAHDLARMIELADQLDHKHYRRDQLLQAAANGSLTRAELRQTISTYKEWIERNQRIEAERIERERQQAQQAQQGNAEPPAQDDTPAPLSPQQQAEQAARQARLDAEAQRRAELDAIQPIAEQLRNQVYAALCTALGTEPQRYEDTGEPNAEQTEHDEPGVYIDMPGWWSSAPIPTADQLHTTHPIILNIPLPLAEAHRLIHWLAHRNSNAPAAAPQQSAGDAAAQTSSPVPSEQNDPTAVIDRFVLGRLRHKAGAKVKAADVHAAYAAWCTRQGLTPTPLNHNRWGDTIAAAGINKVRSNGIHYVGVELLEVVA